MVVCGDGVVVAAAHNVASADDVVATDMLRLWMMLRLLLLFRSSSAGSKHAQVCSLIWCWQC